MQKKQYSLRFLSLLVLLLLASHVSAEVTSSYNSSTNTLTFSGSGDLTKEIVNKAPNISTVCNIVIGSGVTRILNLAFYERSNITRVDFAYATELTYIGDNAFYGCGLTSLTVPSSVTELGRTSFVGNPLRTIEFAPSTSVLSIGNQAFSINTEKAHGVVETFKCFRPYSYDGYNGLFVYEDKLTTVVIGGYTTSVPGTTFYGCSNLKNLTFSGSYLETIGDNAFYDCGLTSLTIPSSVTKLGRASFRKNPLKTIVFAASSTELKIGDAAFSKRDVAGSGSVETFKCHRPFTYDVYNYGLLQHEDKLTTVSLLNMSSIDKLTFYGCDNLTNVTIGKGLAEKTYTASNNLADIFPKVTNLTIYSGTTSIGDYAFYDSPYLTWTDIPESVTSIGEHAFDKCPRLGTNDPISYDDWFASMRASASTITDLYIPNDNVANHGWTADDNLFNLFPSVQKVTFGRSVTQVGNYAFNYARPLEEVTFLNDITNVGKYSFNACPNLTTINGSVKSVDEGSFQNTGISSIKITDDDTIDKNAFNNCWQLTSVELPANLSSIKPYAFFGCSSLSDIMLPARLTAIGEKAFASCTSLAEITIPQGLGLNFMWSDSFERCINLKTVNIESYSFAAYNGQPTDNLGTRFPYATNVNFGPNVTYLGKYAFSSHQNLEKVTFASTCTLRESSFEDCVGLKTIEGTIYPSYEGCLAGCTQLTDGFAITGTIGARAFQNCSSLTCIELPARTTTIRANAFDGCSGLTKVICNQTTPVALTNDMNVFANVPVSNVRLDVPYNSIYVYGIYEVWKDFGEIFAIGGVKLQDGVAYTNTEDQDVSVVRYTRTFSETQANKWQAFLIPFDLNVEDYAEDFDFAQIYAICPTKDTNKDGQIDADDDKVMILSYKRSGTISANVPYMIRPKRAITASFDTENCTLHQAEYHSLEFSTTVMKYTVNGIYDIFTAKPGDHNYYMNVNGELDFAATKNISVGPYRWYMHEESLNYGGVSQDEGLAAPKRMRVAVLGEDLNEETAIRLINGDVISSPQSKDAYIYNLNGTRVDENAPLAKGMYIKNGKTIFVK